MALLIITIKVSRCFHFVTKWTLRLWDKQDRKKDYHILNLDINVWLSYQKLNFLTSILRRKNQPVMDLFITRKCSTASCQRVLQINTVIQGMLRWKGLSSLLICLPLLLCVFGQVCFKTGLDIIQTVQIIRGFSKIQQRELEIEIAGSSLIIHWEKDFQG